MMKIGKKIRWLKTCTSTNDLARDLALDGEEEGAVVIAEEQTKGRGMRGRIWHSPRKKGLYASVVLRPSKSLISLLPIVAGLAVRDALFKSLGVRIWLKWPNDLIWRKKKVGGILCESGFLGNHPSYVILGIGLNINHNPQDFPVQIRPQATSLKIIKKEAINLETLLPGLWQALNGWYNLFLRGEEKKIISAFNKYSALPLGKEITLDTEQGVLEGIFKGINTFGGLILKEKGKERAFFSAQIKAIKSK